MKKLILLLLLLLLPINIKALNISESKIIGNSMATAGTNIDLNIHINLQGFDDEENTLGIWTINYELEFNENDLVIEKIGNSEWDSVLYKENNKYYVQSVVNKEKMKNQCFNNFYCGNYLETITFFIKTNEEKNIDVKLKDITIGLLDTSVDKDKYTIDDLNLIKSVNEKLKTISTKKTNMAIKEVKMNYENAKPMVEEISIEQIEESDNNFIKNLYIKDYSIEFDKNTNSYDLEVGEDVNSLDINILLEDENADYKISGANNLKNNNNRVLIEVIATNGEARIYTINVKKIVADIKAEKNNKFIIPIIGGLLLIIIIGIIAGVRSYLYDRKLDKALEEM